MKRVGRQVFSFLRRLAVLWRVAVLVAMATILFGSVFLLLPCSGEVFGCFGDCGTKVLGFFGIEIDADHRVISRGPGLKSFGLFFVFLAVVFVGIHFFSESLLLAISFALAVLGSIILVLPILNNPESDEIGQVLTFIGSFALISFGCLQYLISKKQFQRAQLEAKIRRAKFRFGMILERDTPLRDQVSLGDGSRSNDETVAEIIKDAGLEKADDRTKNRVKGWIKEWLEAEDELDNLLGSNRRVKVKRK